MNTEHTNQSRQAEPATHSPIALQSIPKRQRDFTAENIRDIAHECMRIGDNEQAAVVFAIADALRDGNLTIHPAAVAVRIRELEAQLNAAILARQEAQQIAQEAIEARNRAGVEIRRPLLKRIRELQAQHGELVSWMTHIQGAALDMSTPRQAIHLATVNAIAAAAQAQAEPVNQQLLALVKSFGHKVGCAKNAFGEQCTCGADEAIAAAEQAQAEPVKQQQAGVYHKFNVSRTDGRDQPGGDRHGAEYFVLDVTHDKFAKPALAAYAAACRNDYPALADDMVRRYGIAAQQQAEPVAPTVKESLTAEPQAEQATLCSSCARANLDCPIYPQQTDSCVEHRPAAQPQAEPVAREFFAYDPECGFETFRTEAEAKKYAQDSIDSYREEASEGWPELVNNICWGVVLGATSEVELPDEYNGCNGLAGYMKQVDYVLTDAAQPPAVAVAVPDDHAQRLEAEMQLSQKLAARVDELERQLKSVAVPDGWHAAMSFARSALAEAIQIAPLDRLPRMAGAAMQQIDALLAASPQGAVTCASQTANSEAQASLCRNGEAQECDCNASNEPGQVTALNSLKPDQQHDNAPPAPDVIDMNDPANWQEGDIVLRIAYDWMNFVEGCEYKVHIVRTEKQEVYIGRRDGLCIGYTFDMLRPLFKWLRHGDCGVQQKGGA